MKKVLFIILALVCVLGLTACDVIFNNEPLNRTYELTFDSTNGSAASTITTTGNEVIALPNDPVREGFIFKGWYFDKDTWQRKLDEDALLINPIFHNRTVYAKWEVKEDDTQLDLTYRIQFQTNGGIEVETRNTNRIPTSPTTTREGFTFQGWFLYETFSYQITFPYVPNNDITLYAKWKENTIDIELTEYTVSFDKGEEAGGAITGTAPEDQIIIRNQELLMPANTFTKEEHDFIGWSDGIAIYAVGEAYAVTADVTFTARWRIRVAPATYTLSYGPGEGTGIIGTPPPSADYETYEIITLPDNPFVRQGYMFVGWYEAVANEVYQAQTAYTTRSRSATLVAKWQIIEYTVVYNNMAGAVNAVSNPTSYTIVTPSFTIAEPTMSGYSFEGWYLDSSFNTPAQTVINQGSMGSKEFHALWKRIELSKQLNAQGNYVITGYTSNSSEIIVPDKIDNIPVTEIAAGAFRNCTTLTTLVIPTSVIRIGEGIINGCHNLTNLTIPFIGELASPTTARYSVTGYLFGEIPLSEPGAVIQNYVDIPTVAFAINGKLKNITLTSATFVPRAAFQNITSLQTVTLNKNVAAINQLAFSGCSSLTTVNFGTQYTVTSIEANAFAGCSQLSTFSVPNTVTNLGSGCFANSGIVTLTVPNSVTEIGQGLISDTNISTLTLPYIGKSRFYTTDAEGVLGYLFAPSATGTLQHLSNTTTASYSIPSSLVALSITDSPRLMYGALSNCTNISTLNLASSLVIIDSYALYNTGISGVTLGVGLTSIGDYAFAQSELLSSITVPSTVTTLGNSAFYNCTALKTVTFPTGSQLTTISNNCFQGCTALDTLNLHDGVREFGDYAFQGCNALPKINISTYTTTIGAYAFADCTLLSSGRTDGTQSIIIPATTTVIGSNAFENCTSIRLLTFTAGALTTIGNYAFANCTGIGITDNSDLRRTTIVIPNNVTSIGNYAFYNCSNVARLDFNKATAKLVTIGEYAFANWTTLGRNLEGESTIDKLEIPGSVTTIGAHAFQNAVNLRQISFEANKLTTINNYAFAGCAALGRNLAGTVNENYTLTIPDSVITIGAYAFAGNAEVPNSVRNIEFTQDSGLTYIGDYAFAYCNEITKIDIGRYVTYIGEGALRGTSRLSEIKVSVNNTAFMTISGSLYNRIGSSSTTLIKYATGKTETSVSVPSGVVEIGSFAFETDNKLTTITLPYSVTIINKNAFEGSSAQIVYLNPTITTISGYAFYGYLGNTITLPNSLISLGNYALAGSNITTIEIPQSVTTIGSYAFAGTQITEINLSANITSISDAAFAGCSTLSTINVHENNILFLSLNGVLFESSASGNTLLQYPAAKAGAVYTVPSDVHAIRTNAFEGANNITSMVIPNSVTSIASGAFSGLNFLQSITLPFIGLAAPAPTTLGAMFATADALDTGAVRQGADYYIIPASLSSVTITNANSIANFAFQNLPLVYVNLGDFIQNIGMNAFENCTANVVFGENCAITLIDDYSFAGFEGQSISLPSTVKIIGERAFFNSQVTQIVFAEDSELDYIEEYAFADSKLSSLAIPKDIISIGRSALEGVGNMTALYLPFIGANADDTDNTLAYLFGSSTTPFMGAVYQTKKNGVTFYSRIPIIQNLIINKVSHIPVGAFMNVNATTIVLEAINFIDENAFFNCQAQVVFGEDCAINNIGINAFANYAYMGDIVLPDTVNTISQNAFFAAKITNVVFGDESELNTIGNFAFAHCINLGTQTDILVLPDSLTVIDTGAFYQSGIKGIFIPENVTEIWSYAFGMCYGLQTITVHENNANYKDTDGVLYSKDSTKLLQYPANAANNAVEIPTGVTTIASYAFAGNTDITSLSIPISVTTIEEYAFAGTEVNPMGLTTISFIGTSQLSVIEKYAFQFCTNLSSVSIPKSVQEIGEGAFSGSAAAPMSLSSFTFAEGSSLLWIGDYALAYCLSLQSFTVPLNIITIGTGILRGCESLNSITLPYIGASRTATGRDAVLGYLFGAADSTINGTTQQYYNALDYDYYNIPFSLRTVTLTNATRISYGAFYGCDTLEFMTLNSDILVIDDYSFYSCNSIRNIIIPDKVISIGDYAFAGTSYRPMSLESVTISQSSSLSTIGTGAFYNCASLTEFFLPQNVTNINAYTFYNSRSLITLELAESSRLIGIGDYAFYNSELGSLTVPADLRTIGESAFESSEILEFTISTGIYRLATIGDRAFSDCANLVSFFVPGSIIVNGMGNRVFYNCTDLQSVSFGAGALADLGEYAFYNCISLQTIILPQALSSIGAYQFYGCNSIASISIPASVQSIGNYAFAGKDGISMGLLSLTFDGISTLQSIGNYAFNLCYSLESVQIPDSLKNIGEKAFYNCSKLANVQISASSQLETISDYAFSGCALLSYLYIPRYINHIGTGAFRATGLSQIEVDVDNNSFMSHEGNLLTKDGIQFIKYATGNTREAYEMPSSVTTIRGYAFADAKNLTSIDLPEGLLTIGEYAFSNASGLTGISLPQTVHTIQTYAFTKANSLVTFVFEGNSQLSDLGAYAFFNCKSLIEIILPTGITVIPDSLFYGCTALFRVGMGYITEIGRSAFYGCSRLTQIVLPITLQKIGDYAFYNCASLPNVTIGASLTTIGIGAFSGCESIIRFEVSPDNANYVSSNSALYTKNYTELLIYPAGKADATYIINSRTTRISAYAFLSAKNLKSISLPSRISFIGYRAFYGATSLVIYANTETKPLGWDAAWNTSCPVYWDVTVNNYGSDYQFIIDTDGNAIITRYLGSEKSFTFPAFVEKVDATNDIPVIGIGSGTMLGLDFVHSVLIPSNISYMGARAFDDNAKLTIYAQASSPQDGWNANWNADSRPVYWSVNAINITDNYEYIIVNSSNVTITRYIGTAAAPVIPNFIESINVTRIGAYAFSASNITGITLPDNLHTIEAYAFAYCAELTMISIPNKVRTINNFAFAYCTSLAIANIAPDSGVLTTIGWNVFTGCSSLEQIIIPETVITIGGQVFKDCGNGLVIICRHTLASGEPTAIPIGWNINWRLKGYINGVAQNYTFIWQRA